MPRAHPVPDGTYSHGNDGNGQLVTRHELDLFSRPIVEAISGLNENVAALRKDLASTRTEIGSLRTSQRPSTSQVIGVLGAAVAIGMAYFMVLDARDEQAKLATGVSVNVQEARDTREMLIALEATVRAYESMGTFPAK